MERFEATERDASRWWAIVALAAAMVAMAFGRFTYPVLLPAIEADLLGSYTLAGFLGTANLTA